MFILTARNSNSKAGVSVAIIPPREHVKIKDESSRPAWTSSTQRKKMKSNSSDFEDDDGHGKQISHAFDALKLACAAQSERDAWVSAISEARTWALASSF